MQSYTFSGPKAEYTTVTATDEYQARHLAMVARWGPPVGVYKHPYAGYGLTLVSVEQAPD